MSIKHSKRKLINTEAREYFLDNILEYKTNRGVNQEIGYNWKINEVSIEEEAINRL